MMKCMDEGFIQAYLDGECSHEEFQRFSSHLESCQSCLERFIELAELESWTKGKVEQTFFPSPQSMQVDTDAAWQAFSAQVNKGKQGTTGSHVDQNSRMKKRSWANMNKRTKQWMAGVSAAAVVVTALSFPQVQAAAKDLLSIFRVDKVAFVKVTQEDLQHAESWLSSGNAGELELNGIGKLSIDESDKESMGSVWYETKEEALEAGVELPVLPDDVKINGLDVHGAHTVHFEINTEKANNLLTQIGVENRFDDKLNGERFSLKVPQSINMYLKSADGEFTYNVVDSLQLQAPQGVDLAELRDTVLALPFIPDHVRKQMVDIEDWQSTLPMPYVEDKDNQVKEVKVNGEPGLLVNSEYRSYLMWQHDGSIHMLDGAEQTGDQLLALAKKLK